MGDTIAGMPPRGRRAAAVDPAAEWQAVIDTLGLVTQQMKTLSRAEVFPALARHCSSVTARSSPGP